MHLPVYANCGPAERAAQIQSLVLPAILSDPMVRLVMKADGVDPKALERDLWDIAANLPCSAATSIPKCGAQAC
jgi:hypothetical protein